MTIKQLINLACVQLAATNKLAAVNELLEAEIILAHVLGKDRAYLKTWPEAEVSVDQQQGFTELLARRIQGEPIAYIIGSNDFWDFSVKVNRDVLVPRPETEHLVELALLLIPENLTVNLADLGTGSGVIACALAKARPKARIFAIDKSLAALQLAKENAESLAIDNIDFYQGDWFEAFLPGQFPSDVESVEVVSQENLKLKPPKLSKPPKFFCILSNPPYIAADDPHLVQDGLQFEPQQALVAAKDGYQDLQHIIGNAQQFLIEGGWLLLEHGYQQAVRVREFFLAENFAQVKTHQDLSGNDRVTVGQKL